MNFQKLIQLAYETKLKIIIITVLIKLGFSIETFY